ncbi:MAG: hypothetical protein [Caudoviricetes sp.]|nr:MAG: hypothetical protein [Caudoviricetes sp.]
MKKIPLHSLIINIGPDSDVIIPSCKNYTKDYYISSGFQPHEIISICDIIENICGDYRRYDFTNDAISILEKTVDFKLKNGEKIVIIGNFSLKSKRDVFTSIAKKYDVPVFYMIMDENLYNTEISYGRKQKENFKNNMRSSIKGDGGIAIAIDSLSDTISAIKKIDGDDALESLKENKFYGITSCGDIHGMHDLMLETLDWSIQRGHLFATTGDFIDYGPSNMKCINTLYERVIYGNAITTIGNHEKKIQKWIDLYENGVDYNSIMTLSDGNLVTINEFLNLSEKDFITMATKFKTILNHARHHYVFGSKLFVHAAAEPSMFKNTSPRLIGRLEVMALYGEIDPTNKKLENGYPNRIYTWVDRIPEGKTVIVGHDIRSKKTIPKFTGELGGQAIFCDCGSGKGGSLGSCDLRFNDDKSDLDIINFNMRK